MILIERARVVPPRMSQFNTYLIRMYSQPRDHLSGYYNPSVPFIPQWRRGNQSERKEGGPRAVEMAPSWQALTPNRL